MSLGGRRLGPGQKAAVYLTGGTLAFLLLCCGGAAVIGTVTGDSERTDAVASSERASDRAPSAPKAKVRAKASASQPPSASPTPSPSPSLEKRHVTETQEIPFSSTTVDDPSSPKGTRTVRTPGAAGVKTLTYEVTFVGGVQTDKRLIAEKVTKDPITEVTAVGTKEAASNCDPNYSGACVPVASDVDCAGGGGNGPAYVNGPVKVIGSDVYDLDRDGDGWGCE